MAQPNPIFVTPSTTVVEVLQLQTPYTPVILNSFNYQGQVVSVLDGSSSIGALYNSIVVSTASGTFFKNGAISTLINQPQGFLTVQSQSPNSWAFLNSFPFRDQYLSAGLYTLTTSTFTTALLSSIQTYTNSLAVEKLVVSGNLTQSSPILFNQTISTFGSVDLYSSFSVWQSTFFSSALSTVGAVQLLSSVIVDGTLVSYSSLRFLSSVFVSGSASVVGNVSAGLVSLSSGLATRSLEVVGSTITAVNSAGSLDVSKSILVRSTINFGGDFEASTLSVQNFQTFSSLAVADSFASQYTLLLNSLSTQQELLVNANLTAGLGSVRVNGPVLVGSNLTVNQQVSINGFLSTKSAVANSLIVFGEFQATSSFLYSTNALRVGRVLYPGDFQSLSTSIGGVLSTTASASLYSNLRGNALSSLQEISTLTLQITRAISTSQFSVSGNIVFSGSTVATGDVTVYGTTSFANTQFFALADYFNGDMNVARNLIVGGTLIISSINLPPAVTGNDFFVSTLYVGDSGIVSSSLISSIEASSIGTGGVTRPRVTMEMSNVLQTQNLSTIVLSTLLFNAQLVGQSSASTFFNVTSSFAVGYPNQQNRFDVGPLTFTTYTLNAAQRISTLRVQGGVISGTFQGDGSQLTNTSYPTAINISNINVSTSLNSGSVKVSSIYASSIVTTGFSPISTFQINGMNIYGNTAKIAFLSSGIISPSISTPFLAGIAGNGVTYSFPFPSGSFLDTENQVRLNTLIAVGNNLGITTSDNPRGAVLNNSKILGFENTNVGGGYLAWSFAIGDTLRVDRLPGQVLQFTAFLGDTLFLEGGYSSDLNQNISFLNDGSTYVSSGRIVLSNLAFIPDGESPLLSRGSNTIQTQLSTLIFNSTLFADRKISAVGIGTQPYYTLDVKGILSTQNVFANMSTAIQNQISFSSSNESLWLANTPTEYPNLTYSVDDGSNWSKVFMTNDVTLDANAYYAIASDGGSNAVDNSNYYPKLTLQKTWVAVGRNLSILFTRQNPIANGNWQPASIYINVKAESPPYYCDVQYNGQYWITVGGYISYGSLASAPTATILQSYDGIVWSNVTSGGFNIDFNYYYYIQNGGGRGVAWNGELWVAVGQGSNSYSGSNSGSNITVNNSILYSQDGFNWSNAQSGYGFTENLYNFSYSGGFDVTWTGKTWVAVGFTAGPGILYSSNGKNWSEVESGFSYSSGQPGWGTALGWNGSRLVAAGFGDTPLLYSDNYGISWSACVGDIGHVTCNVTWNGSYWFANGYDGILKSTDGYSWTQIYYRPTLGIAYNSNASPSLTVGTSQTLKTISTLGPPPPAKSVAVGEETYYGQGNTLYYTTDGSNWTSVTNTILGTANAVAYGNGRWIAGGGSSNFFSGSNVFTSTDAQTWVPIDLTSIFYYYGTPTIRSVAYVNNTWFLGTEFSYANYTSILTSTDGLSWQSATPTYFGTAANELGTYGFAYGPNAWRTFGGYLAVGQGYSYNSQLLYSADGVTWYYATGLSGFFQNYVNYVYGILYANSTWFVVGSNDGTCTTILYSSDAQSWTNCSFAVGDFNVAYGIAYNGTNLFVAVGSNYGAGNTIKYSGNGITWSNATGDFTTAAYSVTYNADFSLWIAGGASSASNGTDTLLYSGDGITWSNNQGTVFNLGYGVASSPPGEPTLLSVRNYYDRLEFLRNPLPGVTSRDGTPYIGYTSSILDLNNALQFTKNLSSNNSTRATITSQSTFTQKEYTNISQTLSTNKLLTTRAFTLGTQYI